MEPNIILTWLSGEGALSHDVYLGTDYSDVNNADINDVNVYMSNQNVNNWNPWGLDFATTYYWRIDERGFYGTTKGNIWSFTTTLSSPDKSTNPVPADDSNNIFIYNNVLNWTGGDCAVSSDVYFGTSFSDVNEANTLSAEYKGNQTATSYDTCNNFDVNTIYYWRIDEKNSYGTTKGDIWNFTTSLYLPPSKATNPNPANGAADLNIIQDLSWTAGANAISHDVYFGTTNPPPFMGNQTGTNYDTETEGKVYYWRIDEKNYGGITTGDLWSFTISCYAGMPDYAEWVDAGKPTCWCYPRQCHGDADGIKTGGGPTAGYYYVSQNDLNTLITAWQVKNSPKGPGLSGKQGCADFNRTKTGNVVTGYYRVSQTDLNILISYWQVKESPKGPGTPANCLPGNRNPPPSSGDIIIYQP
ncbi:MAG: hypothetical protein WC496_12610 [Phycisphaerae bacterium]